VPPVEPPGVTAQAPLTQYGAASGQSESKLHAPQLGFDEPASQNGAQVPPGAQPSPGGQSVLSAQCPQVPLESQPSPLGQSCQLRHATQVPRQNGVPPSRPSQSLSLRQSAQPSGVQNEPVWALTQSLLLRQGRHTPSYTLPETVSQTGVALPGSHGDWVHEATQAPLGYENVSQTFPVPQSLASSHPHTPTPPCITQVGALPPQA